MSSPRSSAGRNGVASSSSGPVVARPFSPSRLHSSPLRVGGVAPAASVASAEHATPAPVRLVTGGRASAFAIERPSRAWAVPPAAADRPTSPSTAASLLRRAEQQHATPASMLRQFAAAASSVPTSTTNNFPSTLSSVGPHSPARSTAAGKLRPVSSPSALAAATAIIERSAAAITPPRLRDPNGSAQRQPVAIASTSPSRLRDPTGAAQRLSSPASPSRPRGPTLLQSEGAQSFATRFTVSSPLVRRSPNNKENSRPVAATPSFAAAATSDTIARTQAIVDSMRARQAAFLADSPTNKRAAVPDAFKSGGLQRTPTAADQLRAGRYQELQRDALARLERRRLEEDIEEAAETATVTATEELLTLVPTPAPDQQDESKYPDHAETEVYADEDLTDADPDAHDGALDETIDGSLSILDETADFSAEAEVEPEAEEELAAADQDLPPERPSRMERFASVPNEPRLTLRMSGSTLNRGSVSAPTSPPMSYSTLSSVCVTPPPLPEPAQEIKQVDVVIIGAGLSGLAAATRLAERAPHLRVVVVEASSRVGGRVLTRHVSITQPNGQSANMQLDEGGQWIAPEHTSLRKLAAQWECPLVEQYHTGTKIASLAGRNQTYSGALPSFLSFWAMLKMSFLMRKLDALAASLPIEPTEEEETDSTKARRLETLRDLDSQTVYSWSRANVTSSSLRSLLAATVRGLFGVEVGEVSMLTLASYIRSNGGSLEHLVSIPAGHQHESFAHGAQTLAEKMALAFGFGQYKRVQLRMDTPVSRVTNRVMAGEATEAQTGPFVMEVLSKRLPQGTDVLFRAQQVIIACAPVVHARIEFSPRLGAAKESLSSRAFMGSAVKIVLLYSRAFWREAGFSGEVFVDGEEDVVNSPVFQTYDGSRVMEGDTIQPGLVVFVNGEAARGWSTRDPEERKQAVLNHLARLFVRTKATVDEVTGPIFYDEQDWAAAEWTQGCPVSLVAPGALWAAGSTLRSPSSCGHIHFGGTEASLTSPGFMDGAVRSGQAAADEVRHALTRPSPTLPSLKECDGDLDSTSEGEQLDGLLEEEEVAAEDVEEETPAALLKYLLVMMILIILAAHPDSRAFIVEHATILFKRASTFYVQSGAQEWITAFIRDVNFPFVTPPASSQQQPQPPHPSVTYR